MVFDLINTFLSALQRTPAHDGIFGSSLRTGRFSTFQPRLAAISCTLWLVTLSMTFFESGTTTVTLSPSTSTPMKPLVLNSSTSVCVALSKCRVMS